MPAENITGRGAARSQGIAATGRQGRLEMVGSGDLTRFCVTVLGASSWADNGTELHVTRFDNMKKYRVPNTFSIDDFLGK